MQEMQVWALGWEDPQEEAMATHLSILAWRIAWTKEPGRLQSIVLQRAGHNWSDLTWANRTLLHFRLFLHLLSFSWQFSVRVIHTEMYTVIYFLNVDSILLFDYATIYLSIWLYLNIWVISIMNNDAVNILVHSFWCTYLTYICWISI